MQELAKALSKWCFKMSGVLRVVSVDHRLANDPKGNPPASYTIKVRLLTLHTGTLNLLIPATRLVIELHLAAF